MRATTLFVGAAVLSLALASCGAPMASGAHFAPGADVSRPLTFSWDQGRDLTIGDPRLANNQFFEDRLHEAIEWELSLRGIRRTDASPDLRIHHHLTLADHESVDEIIDEQGYSRTEVYSYEEGTVVVHITDARTGGSVWVAWAQASIEPALRGPENMRRWVYDIVREMFKTWPVPPGPGLTLAEGIQERHEHVRFRNGASLFPPSQTKTSYSASASPRTFR